MEVAVSSKAPLQVLTWVTFFFFPLFFPLSSFYTMSCVASLASSFRTQKLAFRGNFVFSYDAEQRARVPTGCNQTLIVDVCGKVRVYL